MPMKSLIKYSAVLLGAAVGLSSLSHAAPLLSLGDDGALFVTGVGEIRYEDNVYRDETNRQDDFRFRFEPGVELQFGGGAAVASLFASGEIVRYADESDLDDEYLHLRFAANLDQAVYSLGLYARYDERSSADSFMTDEQLQGRLVTRDEIAAGVNGRYAFTNLTSVAVGLHYESRDYNRASAVGYDSFSIPVTFYYEVSPGLDAQIGYQHRRVDLDSDFGGDYRDNSLFAGFVGQLGSPMWVGDVKIGWMERNIDGFFGMEDRKLDSITYDVGMTYNATNSSYTLRVERDYLNSIDQGHTYSRSQISLAGRFNLIPMWAATGMVGYNRSDYSGIDRSDDGYFVRTGLVYSPNDYMSVSAHYTHQRVDDNGRAAGTDYRANIISLSASLRY